MDKHKKEAYEVIAQECGMFYKRAGQILNRLLFIREFEERTHSDELTEYIRLKNEEIAKLTKEKAEWEERATRLSKKYVPLIHGGLLDFEDPYPTA